MSSAGAFAHFVDNDICSLVPQLMNCVAILGIVCFGTFWIFMARSRQKLIKVVEETRGDNPMSFLHPDMENFRYHRQVAMPMVTVVMPCKVCSVVSSCLCEVSLTCVRVCTGAVWRTGGARSLACTGAQSSSFLLWRAKRIPPTTVSPDSLVGVACVFFQYFSC
jgi:hypothetical protein